MLRAVLIVAFAVAVLAACAPATHVDGHKIRAGAGSADALHEDAPARFTAWWGEYLRHARNGYAVLALDRNGQGGWYVYCGTIGCHVLDHVSVGPIRDVHYKYPALEHCREAVAKAAQSAAAPDCAIYAIRDTIVWQGPLPWEGAEDTPAPSASLAAVGATADVDGPSFALDMLAFWRVKWRSACSGSGM